MASPAEVRFSKRRSVQPDVFVVPLVNDRPASSFNDVKRLTLVVEVISPSSARIDRYKKRQLYQSEGVPEYWIVDADGCFVERWRPGDEEPEILIESVTWSPQDDVAPLAIDLRAFFRRVHEGSKA